MFCALPFVLHGEKMVLRELGEEEFAMKNMKEEMTVLDGMKNVHQKMPDKW